MTGFEFRGTIPESKSILNRLLVIQSFAGAHFYVRGESRAEDVERMHSALHDLLHGHPADCGAAGTTLRFLALRASRIPGKHVLKGTERLFSRPQEELLSIFAQLGAQCEIQRDQMVIESEGWKSVPSIEINRSLSSQFASAVVLCAWNLPHQMALNFSGQEVSSGYFDMTLELVARCGMKWKRNSRSQVVIPAGAIPAVGDYEAEIDVSSAFSIAALAAVGGEALIQNWPGAGSLQPDARFPQILTSMGCEVTEEKNTLLVRHQGALQAIDCNLNETPDLFPVLAVLAALAEGQSRLHGAPHLVHKESNRLERIAELLTAMGAKVERLKDGLAITGPARPDNKTFKFSSDQDHRLAMAVAVARQAGFQIDLLGAESVQKSFPDFWSYAGAKA